MQAGLNPSSTTGSLTEITNDAIEKLEFGKKLDKAQTQFENDSKRIKDGLLPEATPKLQPAPQLKSNAFPRTLPLFKLAQADTTAQAAPVATAGALTDAQRADFFKKFDFYSFQKKDQETGGTRIITRNIDAVHFATMLDKRTGRAFSISPIPEGVMISGKHVLKGSVAVSIHDSANLSKGKSAIYGPDGKLQGNVKNMGLDARAQETRKTFKYEMYENINNLKFEPDTKGFDSIINLFKENLASGKTMMSEGVLHNAIPD
jgi:hypothetical protein